MQRWKVRIELSVGARYTQSPDARNAIAAIRKAIADKSLPEQQGVGVCAE